MQLDLTKSYSRTNNVLYQEGKVIVRFISSKFPDFDKLSNQGVRYMQSYINMWPDKIEILDADHIVIDDPVQQAPDPQAVAKWYGRVAEITNRQPIQVGGVRVHQDEVESVSVGEETVHLVIEGQILQHNPDESRLEQVRYYFDNGIKSPSQIAKLIDANPSYVQRLVKQIKDELEQQQNQ